MLDPNLIPWLSKYASIVGTGHALAGGELSAFISEIADQEVSAAVRAAEDSQISSDPVREINMAIQAIRLAFERYLKLGFTAELVELGRGLVSLYSFGLLPNRTKEWANKAVRAASALTLLYSQQGDEALARRYTEAALECYRQKAVQFVEANLPRHDKEGSSRRRDAVRDERRSKVEQEGNSLRKVHADILRQAFPGNVLAPAHFSVFNARLWELPR